MAVPSGLGSRGWISTSHIGNLWGSINTIIIITICIINIMIIIIITNCSGQLESVDDPSADQNPQHCNYNAMMAHTVVIIQQISAHSIVTI